MKWFDKILTGAAKHTTAISLKVILRLLNASSHTALSVWQPTVDMPKDATRRCPENTRTKRNSNIGELLITAFLT